MDALRRSNPRLMSRIRHRAQRVGPDPRRINDYSGLHGNAFVANLESSTPNPRFFDDEVATHCAVENGRPEVCSGPGDGQSQSGIVGATVIVEKTALEMFGIQLRRPGQHLCHAELLV